MCEKAFSQGARTPERDPHHQMWERGGAQAFLSDGEEKAEGEHPVTHLYIKKPAEHFRDAGCKESLLEAVKVGLKNITNNTIAVSSFLLADFHTLIQDRFDMLFHETSKHCQFPIGEIFVG